MIDSHTHLDDCEPPNEELVAAARDAGLTRMLTVGTDPDSCRAALAAAERFEEVYAAIGCHPTSPAARHGAAAPSSRRTRAAWRSVRRP